QLGSGPSEAEVRAAFADLPVVPSDEAVLWLSRHDWNGQRVLPYLQAMSAEQVARNYQEWRALAAEAAEVARRQRPYNAEIVRLSAEDHLWSPDWLMLFWPPGASKYVLDC